jgi:hypothetical protein
VFADYDKYFGVENVENEMRKKYQLGNPASAATYSQPYHFIYTYNDGHAVSLSFS